MSKKYFNAFNEVTTTRSILITKYNLVASTDMMYINRYILFILKNGNLGIILSQSSLKLSLEFGLNREKFKLVAALLARRLITRIMCEQILDDLQRIYKC